MLNKLAKEIHQNAVEHGWWNEERHFGSLIALMHAELSEAFMAGKGFEPIGPEPMIMGPVGGRPGAIV